MGSSTGGHASLIGTTLGGYEVQALIGRGAMGTVYLARDVALNRPVALKVLLGNLARNPELVKSLHMEAQATAPLRHPSIVRIYKAGVEEGTPYIAMEYVAGESLERFLRRRDHVYWSNALYIGQQVAEALACAHAQGIVHRDVKPANVLLDCKGRCHLADFGIANVTSKQSGLAMGEEFVGTPHYMSPEQCAGGEIGPATDLYSLGVAMFRMIAGRLPFEAESHVAQIKKIIADKPPRLNEICPDVPDDVARLVAHLMEKGSMDRPVDAQTVCQMIDRLQVEKGGRSAIPGALAAFIREQAQRPVEVTSSRTRPGAQAKRRPLLKTPAGRWGLRAAVVLVIVTAGLVPAVWSALRPATSPRRAPVIEDFAFSETAQGVLHAKLGARQIRFERMHWVGEHPILVVQAAGRDGVLKSGACGLVALDPEGRRALSLRAPTAPAESGAYWENHTGGFLLNPMPALPVGSPVRDAILLPAYQRNGTGANRQVVALAQHWNEGSPRQDVLCRAPKLAWPQSYSPWHAQGAVQIVPRPDGEAVCLLLEDAHGGNYLVEHELHWTQPDRMGERLTKVGRRVVPGSARYSPDGGQIAFLLDGEKGNRELRILERSRHRSGGTMLALGDLLTNFAFSPDGNSVLVGCRTQPGGTELRVVRAVDGALELRLGEGELGAEPWHPSGKYVVVTRDDADGARAMWAEEAAETRRQVRLTSLAGGSGGCAVSRDGQWAATLAEQGGEPEVVFVSLRGVSF